MAGVPINVRQVNPAGTGTKEWIPLNQHANPDITFNVIITGTVTCTIEGTLVDLNKLAIAGGSLDSEDVFGLTELVGITATKAQTLANQPLAAVRVNQTAGTGDVVLHVTQNGT